MYEVYTDGACSGNPGPGGWSALLVKSGEIIKELSGSDSNTTNNRMELIAVINGLHMVSSGQSIGVYTDSMYVKNGISSWILKWRANGWKTASGGRVKNMDLWVELYDLSKSYQIKWSWVKAHDGNIYNERVDKLARAESRKVSS